MRYRLHYLLAVATVLLTPGLVQADDWKLMKTDEVQQQAVHLVSEFQQAKFKDLQVKLDPDPKSAVGARDSDSSIVLVPIRGLSKDKEYPEVMTEPGGGMALAFLSDGLKPLVDGNPVKKEQIRRLTLKQQSGQQESVTVLVLAARDRGMGDWRLYSYGTPKKPLVSAKVDIASSLKRDPIDLDVTDLKNDRARLVVWMFIEHRAEIELIRTSD